MTRLSADSFYIMAPAGMTVYDPTTSANTQQAAATPLYRAPAMPRVRRSAP